MSDLHPDDPAMSLLNQYIDKRVEAAVSVAVSKFEQGALSRMQAEIVELQQMVEKLKEVNDEVHNEDTSDDDDDDSDVDSDSDGPDLDEVEKRKWGKSYGESSSNKKQPLKKKKKNSDDEKPLKKPKAVKKSAQLPKKKGPGRPLGSKNTTTAKQKLEDENKALKKKLQELEDGQPKN